VTTFRTSEIPSADLDRGVLGQPSAEPLSGEIPVGSKIFFEGLDGRIVSGTWECEPGLSRWEFDTRGEFIHVTAGSMTITRDGEEPVKLTEGSSAIFALGWHGTWEVHDTLRKVFVVFKP
jgi:uncharacterized cupin superfamily protein